MRKFQKKKKSLHHEKGEHWTARRNLPDSPSAEFGPQLIPSKKALD